MSVQMVDCFRLLGAGQAPLVDVDRVSKLGGGEAVFIKFHARHVPNMYGVKVYRVARFPLQAEDVADGVSGIQIASRKGAW